MPRAEVKNYDDEDRFAFVDEFWKLVDACEEVEREMLSNIVENKICSVGKINGAIVAIDYGVS